MSESINKIKVKDITYDVEDSVARAGLDKVLLFESITWAELKSLKDSGNLAPGTKYRITDYITTTTQENTKSAGNQFDIIVEALTENTLSELASACLHEGDTYFSSQGCNLEAWQLWYDLDNDTEKYEWADTENGKGVIYRMIDEKRNDCPYDFKNILFYNNIYNSNTTPDNYYYTFAYVLIDALYDGTVKSDVQRCYGNVIKPYYSSFQSLNQNIFKNISVSDNCYHNSFGNNCYHNSFGDSCYSNSFGDSCYSNSFGDSCHSNTFENDCYHITFGNGCYSNSFGDSCHSNTFGFECNNNTFGNSCHYNTFGNDFQYNTFGDYFYSNIFGDYCYSNIFGGHCSNNTFGGHCYSNTFGNECYSNTFGFECNNNTFGNGLQNRTFNGVNNISITLTEEFYDDGSGSLVPIKHPDLSTQPNILPYKFMGQYVYEQLIPIIPSEVESAPTPNAVPVYNKNLGIEPLKIVFLEAQLIGHNACNSAHSSWYNGGDEYLVFTAGVGYNTEDIEFYDYIRLVYTSMPEDSSYYY